uniref:Fatty-acid and retinol-binding protein 1 n=1 Tax=Panagrolaimus sp. JU765 TaxID=591449 RepID=A0AC34PU90_9BILA
MRFKIANHFCFESDRWSQGGQTKMLSRTFVILAALTIAAWASTLPLGVGNLPDQFKEFLPEEAKDFYADLTEQDKNDLKEIALKHEDFKTEDDALNALKAKNEKLYNKAIALRNLVKEKIESLDTEAKTFVENAIAKMRALRPAPGAKPNLAELRKAANDIIESYKALSDAGKENLKTTFPKITGVIQKDRQRSFASRKLNSRLPNDDQFFQHNTFS